MRSYNVLYTYNIETCRAKTRVSRRRSHACTLRSPHGWLHNRIVELPWKHEIENWNLPYEALLCFKGDRPCLLQSTQKQNKHEQTILNNIWPSKILQHPFRLKLDAVLCKKREWWTTYELQTSSRPQRYWVPATVTHNALSMNDQQPRHRRRNMRWQEPALILEDIHSCPVLICFVYAQTCGCKNDPVWNAQNHCHKFFRIAIARTILHFIHVRPILLPPHKASTKASQNEAYNQCLGGALVIIPAARITSKTVTSQVFQQRAIMPCMLHLQATQNQTD